VAITLRSHRQRAVGFIDWLNQLGLGNLIWTYNRSSPHAEQPEAFAASVKVFVRSGVPDLWRSAAVRADEKLTAFLELERVTHGWQS
jgi:hypothetical protein